MQTEASNSLCGSDIRLIGSRQGDGPEAAGGEAFEDRRERRQQHRAAAGVVAKIAVVKQEDVATGNLCQQACSHPPRVMGDGVEGTPRPRGEP
jgi:hypothetical protein